MMLKPDPNKEFQLNPLTALTPFEGNFEVLSNNLGELESRTTYLENTLNNVVELKAFNEQTIKRMQQELEMLQVILTWSGTRNDT